MEYVPKHPEYHGVKHGCIRIKELDTVFQDGWILFVTLSTFSQLFNTFLLLLFSLLWLLLECMSYLSVFILIYNVAFKCVLIPHGVFGILS